MIFKFWFFTFICRNGMNFVGSVTKNATKKCDVQIAFCHFTRIVRQMRTKQRLIGSVRNVGPFKRPNKGFEKRKLKLSVRWQNVYNDDLICLVFSNRNGHLPEMLQIAVDRVKLKVKTVCVNGLKLIELMNSNDFLYFVFRIYRSRFRLITLVIRRWSIRLHLTTSLQKSKRPLIIASMTFKWTSNGCGTTAEF